MVIDHNAPSKLFVNAFNFIFKSLVSDTKDAALKVRDVSWIIAGLDVSRLAGENTTDVCKMLNIEAEDYERDPPDISTSTLKGLFVHDMDYLPVLSEDISGFARYFNEKVQVSDDQACHVYLSSQGQLFDLMIVYQVKSKPFVLFIDLKDTSTSGLEGVSVAGEKEVRERKQKILNDSKEEFATRREYLKKAAEELKEVGQASQLSPLSEALVSGNYAFIRGRSRNVFGEYMREA
jgi:hypothetical protein